MGKVTDTGQLRQTAQAAKGYADQVMSNVARAALEALEEMDAAKRDRASGTGFTIPASGWAEDGLAGFPYFYDVSAPGVTAADRADVVVPPEGAAAARACGLCPASETRQDAVRLRAASLPETDIPAHYWIEKGVV